MFLEHPKDKPKINDAGIAIDDRGTLQFANFLNFQLLGIKRFYTVSNHSKGFIRAWHGHLKEGKYIFPLRGAAKIAAAAICDIENEVIHLSTKFETTITANKPTVVYIPPQYVNGFMTLTDDAQIMFFSTASLEESAGDDYRFDYGKSIWNPFEVKIR